MFYKDLSRNIFRASLSFIAPDDEGLPILFSYERTLLKPITLIVAGGISFGNLYKDEGAVAVHGFGSVEMRYYLNLKRRLKKDKYVRNYSAIYLGLQESFLSGPIALMGISRENAAKANARTFLNLGIEGQFKRKFVNIFLGPGLHFNDLEKGEWVLVEDFHVGLTLGFVLFE